LAMCRKTTSGVNREKEYRKRPGKAGPKGGT
jgi:hypothetical protein